MELVDYITNTPQNTNKTILKQLISNEKNKAVYESVEELKKSGSVGYEENHEVFCDLLADTDISVPFATLVYKLYSDKTPTQEELKAATVRMNLARAGVEVIGIDCEFKYVIPTPSGIFSTTWGPVDAGENICILVAYAPGQYTITFDGYDVPVVVPKTGLYVALLYTEGTEVYSTATIDITWEHTNTIDPKFLPETEVLDLDEHGISLQTLFAAGGGVHTVDARSLFAKMKRGKQYILRGAYGDHFIEAQPSFIQYEATGDIFAIGVTIKAVAHGNMTTADFEIYRSGGMYCAVSAVAIPSYG